MQQKKRTLLKKLMIAAISRLKDREINQWFVRALKKILEEDKTLLESFNIASCLLRIML